MNQLTRRTHSKCGPAYGWNILWIGFLMPKSLILVPILFENKMLGLHAQAPIASFSVVNTNRLSQSGIDLKSIRCLAKRKIKLLRVFGYY